MQEESFPWIAGLGLFGETWSARRARSLDPVWLERLAKFGAAWRQLAPIESKRLLTSLTYPDADRLANAVKALSEAVQAIRDRGDMFNPWVAARLRQDEVRNASVFASFLTKSQVGDPAVHFLDAFLRRLDNGDMGLPILDDLRRAYRVRREDCPLGLASERVDLTIEGNRFLIGIEVKINASEGDDQFGRYVRTIGQRAKDGRRSPHAIVLARNRIDAPGVVPAIWADVAAAARRAAAWDPGNHVNRMLFAFGTHVSSF